MSTFFGIFDKNKNSVEYDLLDFAMQKMNYWNPDKSSIWIKGHIGMGLHQLTCGNAILDIEEQFYDEANNCFISADSRIDYRKELGEELSITPDHLSTLSDSQLILKAYLKWGEDCLTKLYGDFAFVIWDGRSDSLFCARDHFGIRPLFYINTVNYLMFSSEMNGLLDCSLIETHIKETWIADTLTSSYPDKYDSPFHDIRKLGPAETLSYSNNTEVVRRYWNLSKNPPINNISEEMAVKMIQEAFFAAVENRIRCDNPIGVELSGGLDSSGIAAAAVEVGKTSHKELIALTHISHNSASTQDVDIPSEKVVSYLGIIEHVKISGNNKGVLSAIKESMEINHSSTKGSYAMMSDILYDEAHRRGIRQILSGFGGDEGVTMGARVYLKELAKHWKYLALMAELKYSTGARFLALHKKTLGLILKSHFPLLSLLTNSSREKDERKIARYETFGIDHDFNIRFGISERYLDLNKAWEETSVSTRQVERYDKSAFTARIEESYMIALARRLEISYPFLDVKLVELYHSLPSNLKYRNGVGRYLFRKAVKNWLPTEITNLDDKASVAVPNVPFRFKIDILEFKEIIDEGRKNNSFHYVDYEKMHWMINQMELLERGEDESFIPNTLFNHVQILILQKWQREGRIDIGIKC